MNRPIIFVVESGGLCGGVRVILEEATCLLKRGWDVRIYSVDNKPGWFPLPEELLWRTFPSYYQLSIALDHSEALHVATWWKTAQVVEKHTQPGRGLYLVQDIETSYYFSPMAKEQVVATYNGHLIKYTTSKWVEANLPETHYVGIGLDTDFYHPLELQREPFLLACVRRQALKGYRELGEFCRRLKSEEVGLELVTFGLDPQVRFIGPHKAHASQPTDEQVLELYNTCFAYVSTSQHEGFGLLHLEAMACGTPVLTTNADGNMQFCEDGVNCLVVDKDDMRGLALKAKTLYNDSELRDTLVKNGLETAKDWTWEPVIDRLEAFLQSIN